MPISERKETKPVKKLTVRKLKAKLDKVFSEYIRKRDNGVCFTCGVKKSWKEMQAGHYVSRSHNSLRFDGRNVHCQCAGCNIFKRGAMDVYALRLQEKYGNKILKELNEKRQEVKQFSSQELLSLIETYGNQPDPS